MTTKVEETALSVITEQSIELAPTTEAAAVQAEIQSAIIVAKRFPRNEDLAFQKLMKACQRTSFSEDAAYSFPRGGTPVTGPSVNLAREGARVWGNIRTGLDVIADDEERRTIRAWAWDLETNYRQSAEDSFRKLVQRKDKTSGQTRWVTPDERDLRELTNRRGAILERNCLLKILPKDLIEDALDTAQATLKKGAEQDPELARKKIIMAFSEVNITPDMLEKKLGHPLGQSSPAEIAELRKVYKSVSDGNSTWAEYAGEGEPTRNGKGPEKGTLNMESLKPGREPEPRAESKKPDGLTDKQKAELKAKEQAAKAQHPEVEVVDQKTGELKPLSSFGETARMLDPDLEAANPFKK